MSRPPPARVVRVAEAGDDGSPIRRQTAMASEKSGVAARRGGGARLLDGRQEEGAPVGDRALDGEGEERDEAEAEHRAGWQDEARPGSTRLPARPKVRRRDSDDGEEGRGGDRGAAAVSPAERR